jgi:hypothetical protein
MVPSNAAAGLDHRLRTTAVNIVKTLTMLVLEILTTQEKHRQIFCKTLSQKNPLQKRTGGVAQCVGPKFKSQYHTHTKKTCSYVLSDGSQT